MTGAISEPRQRKLSDLLYLTERRKKVQGQFLHLRRKTRLAVNRTSSDRTDPHNGLLLNTFHDKAFDQGLITVTKDYSIKVAQKVKDYANDEFTKNCLVGLEGTKIILPRNFIPAIECLEYHNDIIFKG